MAIRDVLIDTNAYVAFKRGIPEVKEVMRHAPLIGVYRDLRRIGQPIPTNDMWIAATALQHKLAILSFDGHFKSVDGLAAGSRLLDFVS